VAERVAPAVHRSWWARLRQDLGRRIEHRGLVVWFLIFERGLRGIAVFLLGGYLLSVRQGDIAGKIESIEQRYGLTEGSGSLIKRVAEYLLNQVGHLSAGGLVVLAVGSVLYGSLEVAEAAGLLMRRRWAEYLVMIATGLGIPIEVREVLVRATALRVGLLAINIAVVVYLVVRKRLFIFDEGANA
jgi:uncharacterized membrane protein (DUF2068 family)